MWGHPQESSPCRGTSLRQNENRREKAIVEHLKIEELREFSSEKRIRKKLLNSEKLVIEVVCYEPEQTTPHPHPKQDEIFYVIEGTGTIMVGNEDVPVEPTSLILVSAQESHGIRAAGDSRLVVMFIKAPGSTSSS
jgi:mannose-6-phosphate isomerase-like protein (cupin superfamily)